MAIIRACELPPTSLLRGARQPGAFADCYVTELEREVSQTAFVEAFYTSGLFKIERAVLGLLLARPSTDLQARHLAAGTTTSFAAWRVESRNAEQLLMTDFTGRTRSWLMAESVNAAGRPVGTRLYFGSGVGPRGGDGNMGMVFHALLGFHKLYSRLLLGAARARLLAGP